MRSNRSRPNAPPTAAPPRPPGEPLARPSSRRPRAREGLSVHIVAAGRFPLPASADLLGIRRRGTRSLRALGRLQIGRASCRERVEGSVVDVFFKKKVVETRVYSK